MKRVLIVEHKTTSMNIGDGSDYVRTYRLSPQLSNYMAGAKALGYEPDCILLDLIRKPSIEPYERSANVRLKKDGTPYANVRMYAESPGEYRERLRGDIAHRPEWYYNRIEIARLESDIADSHNDVIHTVGQIAASEENGAWPRTPGACFRYGRWCDFHPVCSGEASLGDPRYRGRGSTHAELSDDEPGQPTVTTSSMATYRRCPREYQHTYVDRVESVYRAPALAFGTLMHHALEAWWLTARVEDATSDRYRRHVSALRALNAHGDGVDPFVMVNAEELILGYHFRWGTETMRVLGVELEFIAGLHECPMYALAGKIDAVCEME